MNEESQGRGCYNKFYLHQPGNSVGSVTVLQIRRIGAQVTAHTKRRPASVGPLGERGRGGK